MLLAWTFEVACGWPNWLYKQIGHPVAWLGHLISALERRLNNEDRSHRTRYIFGVVTVLISLAISIGLAVLISELLPNAWWGYVFEALVASSLIATRSLYDHVSAVARPLLNQDIEQARRAVSMIVGRDPDQLDEPGIARAGLESLAENASDGVIAPIFWGAVLGLPGLAAYKAINTLDSMIGHRSSRYQAFGGFAARLDDLANLLPARLTGILIALSSLRPEAIVVMFRDARQHRSPNAGWPEAAMAGALRVRLSGPRAYDAGVRDEPWLNGDAQDPDGPDLRRGLTLFRRAMIVGVLFLALLLGLELLR
jgi:adenosylcobinamide-phosphate synthase